MTVRERPMPLGDALRWFRVHVGINQTECGIRMGFAPSSAQTAVSQRERPTDHPDYTEPRVTELYRLEVKSGVEPGTILRHAGYVADGQGLQLPPGLTPSVEATIRVLVERDMEGKSPSPPRRPQRRRPLRDLDDED